MDLWFTENLIKFSFRISSDREKLMQKVGRILTLCEFNSFRLRPINVNGIK